MLSLLHIFIIITIMTIILTKLIVITFPFFLAKRHLFFKAKYYQDVSLRVFFFSSQKGSCRVAYGFPTADSLEKTANGGEHPMSKLRG